MGVESWLWWWQHLPASHCTADMMGTDTTTSTEGHSGLYHTSSQVLLARLYDNVLTNLGLRQTCSNCGQLAETESNTSDDNDDDLTDSDVSSTSTDVTVRLTRNYSHHNIEKKSYSETSNLQYSKSLSSLPQILETPVRQRVTFSLHPELVYSNERENNHQANNHQKLIRKNNVLELQSVIKTKEEETESEYTEEEKELEEDGNDDDIENDVLDQHKEMDHYKTMKTGENIYSYAYRDAFSPAALIRLEDCSDVSEDVYDSIKAPSEMSGTDIMSDSMSDKGDLFLSISKGRRNYLKLHRHVGWDLESVREDEGSVLEHGENTNENLTHSRLLPILIHEEVFILLTRYKYTLGYI